MPALTIKNIPEDLYNELKHVAELHHRSINSEVIICLKHSLFPKKTSTEDVLSNIQALRSQIATNVVSVDEIQQAISQGRS